MVGEVRQGSLVALVVLEPVIHLASIAPSRIPAVVRGLLLPKPEFFVRLGLDLGNLSPNIDATGIVLKTEGQIDALGRIPLLKVGLAPGYDVVPLTLVGIPKKDSGPKENPGAIIGSDRSFFVDGIEIVTLADAFFWLKGRRQIPASIAFVRCVGNFRMHAKCWFAEFYIDRGIGIRIIRAVRRLNVR